METVIQDTEAKPLRRDAERNRQLIMAAARELFAERGLDVTLDDIARHAGVGVGTAYRRFANKDVLIDELFEASIAEMVDLAQRALDIEDPWDSLVTFMQQVHSRHANDRGLKQVLMTRDDSREKVCAARDRIAPLSLAILNRAKDAGVVRQDLDESDLPMISLMIGQIMDVTRDVEPEAWRRYLGLVLDAMRADGSQRSVLTPAAMTRAQADEAMHAAKAAKR